MFAVIHRRTSVCCTDYMFIKYNDQILVNNIFFPLLERTVKIREP